MAVWNCPFKGVVAISDAKEIKIKIKCCEIFSYRRCRAYQETKIGQRISQNVFSGPPSCFPTPKHAFSLVFWYFMIGEVRNHLCSKLARWKSFPWSDQKILQNVSGGALESSKSFGIKKIAWVVLAPEFFSQDSRNPPIQNKFKTTYGRKWTGARLLNDQIEKPLKMSLEELLNFPKILE